MSEQERKVEVKDTVSQISLKLRDHTGAEIEFKVKTSTKFAKIAKAYADKKGVDLNSLRFGMDGERITVSSDQTVEALGLEDGDVVDVEIAQIGGWGNIH